MEAKLHVVLAPDNQLVQHGLGSLNLDGGMVQRRSRQMQVGGSGQACEADQPEDNRQEAPDHSQGPHRFAKRRAAALSRKRRARFLHTSASKIAPRPASPSQMYQCERLGTGMPIGSGNPKAESLNSSSPGNLRGTLKSYSYLNSLYLFSGFNPYGARTYVKDYAQFAPII